MNHPVAPPSPTFDGAVAPPTRQGEPDIDRLAAAVLARLSAIAIILTPDGVIVDLNDAALSLIGSSRQGLLGRALGDVTSWRSDPERAHWLIDMLAAARADKRPREDITVRSGEHGRVLDLSVVPMRAADLPAPMLILEAHDVTTARRLERELRASESRYAGIISLATDAIVSVDADARIVLFNTGAERIFGYTSAEITGQPLDLLIPERSRDRHRAHLAGFAASPVAARRMGERTAILGRRKTGETFPAEAAISKMEVDGARYYTAVLRDTTAQVESEAERERLLAHAERARTMAEVAQTRAEEAERRTRFLADASMILDASLDYEETLRTIAQLVVPRMAAFVIVDVVNEHDVVQRLDVLHRDATKRETARRLRDLPLDWTRPHTTMRAQATLRVDYVPEVTADIIAGWAQTEEHLALLQALAPTSFIAVPLIARERVLGAIGLGLDDPARRYTRADVSDAEELGRRVALAVDNARLYRAAQRATDLRNEILGIVSHDLRNPLSVVAMCASTLVARPGLGEEEASRLGATARDAARWMERLVGDLLDMASIDSGRLSLERRLHDPVIVAARSATMLEHRATERGIALEVVTPESLPSILVDGERIGQALTNMIANALKFTDPGGRVRVEVSERGADIEFAVHDTGCGIAPHLLPRVFDRFWHATHNSSARGSGLGLSIAKGVVEAHGGRIGADSEVGVGSRFYFLIPRAASAMPAP